MDLTKMRLFQMAHERMGWAAQRQRVLAQNVGQMDTPNYRPQDVRELDFKTLATQKVAPVQVSMTHAGHQPGTLPPTPPYRTDEQRRSFETTLDGNTVVLEEQMRKIGETKSKFMLAASLFESNMKMLRTALGKQ